MADEQLLLEYDGGDADAHTVDLRLIGESFQGIERIISDLIIVTAAGRLPKKGERASLVVKVYEPRAGSVTIPAVIRDGAGLLQLGWQVAGPIAQDLITNWIKGVFAFHSGQKDQAEEALGKVAELALAHNEALRQVEEHRHDEAMGLHDIVRRTVERLGPATEQAVAPVGPSVRRLTIASGEQRQLAADDNIADAIREHGQIEFGPLQTFVLRTDGFVFHTKKLSIEHPKRSGYLLAEVDDPIAEQENNPYARAVQTKALIRVKAKAGYHNGQIERLVVVDFEAELGNAA